MAFARRVILLGQGAEFMRSRWTAVGVAFAASCVFGIWYGRYVGLNPGEWASWVQAIGSIGAILAAAGVVWTQHLLETKRRQAEARALGRQRLDAAFQIVNNACAVAERIQGWANNNGQLDDDLVPILNDYDSALLALQRLDPVPFETGEVIAGIISAVAAATRLLDGFQPIRTPGAVFRLPREHLQTLAIQSVTRLRYLADSMKAARDAIAV